MSNSTSGQYDYTLNPLMTEDERTALLNAEWQSLYSHFDTKARAAKKNFQTYKYLSIILAGATSIGSSLVLIYGALFPQWILPVLSAVATVAVAYLGASSSQKIWINSRTTGQQLQVEKFLFNQRAGKYHNIPLDESIRLFSERLIQIWNEGHGKWEQTVNEA